MSKIAKVTEYGDFQTPMGLAVEVCALLHRNGLRPESILEPTCGFGNFLFASLDCFPEIRSAIGVDVSADHIRQAAGRLVGRAAAVRVELINGDFFDIDWQAMLERLPEPVLVIGNPPWVTNSELGGLGSRNVPEKSNFQRRNGLDARTGKANFDISEWMLIRLVEAMSGRRGAIAVLCKTGVARKVLLHAWKQGAQVSDLRIYNIDAGNHFGVAVDACLLVIHFSPNIGEEWARIYPTLEATESTKAIGYESGTLFADLSAHTQLKHLQGTEQIKWRSGIKHDCAKVMELRREGELYRNGLGQVVELEDRYLYPMLKSSEIANGRAESPARRMIVTQQVVGGDTTEIQREAPLTWRYLQSHGALLDERGSSIYRKLPRFSVFGVGVYTFAPWKVAISGFYKRLTFTVVGSADGKPIVLDDTCYFLPCAQNEDAVYLASLLNSDAARKFFSAYVFWDSKRPITADLLRRLDLRLLARELGSEEHFCRVQQAAQEDGANRRRSAQVAEELLLWPP